MGGVSEVQQCVAASSVGPHWNSDEPMPGTAEALAALKPVASGAFWMG
jgi:hypothetical protein